MNFKNLLFVLLLTAITNVSSAQLFKFRSTSFSTSIKDKYTQKWDKWSDFEESAVLINVDLTNERIKIFSKKEQTYDIIKYYDKVIDGEGDETYQFLCVNGEGVKCYVTIVILNSQNRRQQIYIDFADVKWMYNVYKIE